MDNSSRKGQLELGLQRAREKDRNHHLGGRSFYFFDFDDNIAFLRTPLVLFHKKTDEELHISSGEWARSHSLIGLSGAYQDYEIRFDDRTGTFRYFRDQEFSILEKLGYDQQIFIKDVKDILKLADFDWKGPSWECFYHATFNQRPISVITARGHNPETLKQGIQVFVNDRLLPLEPNYLSVFPVSHTQTRLELGDVNLKMNTAQLKQRAIRASVEKAIEIYGYNDHHRFGMSDDDPKNLQLIYDEMRRLKSDYPQMSFFLIETHNNDFIKHEITLSATQSLVLSHHQLNLFETL